MFRTAMTYPAGMPADTCRACSLPRPCRSDHLRPARFQLPEKEPHLTACPVLSRIYKAGSHGKQIPDVDFSSAGTRLPPRTPSAPETLQEPAYRIEQVDLSALQQYHDSGGSYRLCHRIDPENSIPSDGDPFFDTGISVFMVKISSPLRITRRFAPARPPSAVSFSELSLPGPSSLLQTPYQLPVILFLLMTVSLYSWPSASKPARPVFRSVPASYCL